MIDLQREIRRHDHAAIDVTVSSGREGEKRHQPES